MHPYDIVPAGEGDLESLAVLAREIWLAHYPGIVTHRQIDYMLDQSYAFDTLAQDIANGTHIDLLVIDGEAQGFAAYGPAPGDRPNDGLAEAKLHKLYLRPSFHGHGLGSTLLQHVESECLGSGINRIVLNVCKHNSGAIKTYGRCGYQIIKSIFEPIGEGFFVDDYVMAHRLA